MIIKTKREINADALLERVNNFLGKDMSHQSLLATIEELLNVAEQERKEYITLSQSIAEDDTIIDQLEGQLDFFTHSDTVGYKKSEHNHIDK